MLATKHLLKRANFVLLLRLFSNLNIPMSLAAVFWLGLHLIVAGPLRLPFVDKLGERDLHFPCGSYLPFANDAASRSGDTRKSLAERYPTPAGRARPFIDAVDQLKKDGFLLEEDASTMLRD